MTFARLPCHVLDYLMDEACSRLGPVHAAGLRCTLRGATATAKPSPVDHAVDILENIIPNKVRGGR